MSYQLVSENLRMVISSMLLDAQKLPLVSLASIEASSDLWRYSEVDDDTSSRHVTLRASRFS